MAENKMEQVAKLLGVELEEEFKIDDNLFKYKLTRNGLMYYADYNGGWDVSGRIEALLKGKYEIIKLPKSILTEEEKEYLSNIINHEYFVNTLLKTTGIKSFEYKIYIMKMSDVYLAGNPEWIFIVAEAENNKVGISLPYFKAGTMYKGMELGKRYSLEDLGI